METKMYADPVFRGILLSAVALTILLTACSRPNQEIESATVGKITVYTALLSEQVKAYLPSFHEAYPAIQVTIVRESTDALTRRLFAERDDPQADVIWGLSVTNLVPMEWHDMLTPYAPIGLQHVLPQFRDTGNPPYWVGMDIWMAAFCINTAALQKLGVPMPRSWQELIKQDYAERLAMPDPTTTGTGYMIAAGILQRQGEIDGWVFLDVLQKNIKHFSATGTEACQLAGKGEVPIGISYGLAGIKTKAMESIEVIFPAEGSSWDMEACALLKKHRIKPAATTFLDWAISKRAMQAYGQYYAITAVKTDIPLRQGFPAEPTKQLYDKDFPWATANRDRILREWQKRYANRENRPAKRVQPQ